MSILLQARSALGAFNRSPLGVRSPRLGWSKVFSGSGRRAWLLDFEGELHCGGAWNVQKSSNGVDWAEASGRYDSGWDRFVIVYGGRIHAFRGVGISTDANWDTWGPSPSDPGD